MPVFLEDHDSTLDLRPGTTRSDVVAYLYRNPEWGYSPAELTEALSIPRGTATTTLKRLFDDDYVGRTDDGYYHALKDRADVRRYVSNLEQASRLFGHHRNENAAPEEPEQRIGTERTDADLDAELTELENELDASDE